MWQGLDASQPVHLNLCAYVVLVLLSSAHRAHCLQELPPLLYLHHTPYTRCARDVQLKAFKEFALISARMRWSRLGAICAPNSSCMSLFLAASRNLVMSCACEHLTRTFWCRQDAGKAPVLSHKSSVHPTRHLYPRQHASVQNTCFFFQTILSGAPGTRRKTDMYKIGS